jgi:hypothetical protein
VHPREPSLNEAVPRPDENLWSWVRRVDSASAEAVHQREPLVDQHAAYRVGNAVGAWSVLYEGLKLLEHERDARRLLMLLLAEQIGLPNRRGDVHTVNDFLTQPARCRARRG